MGGGTHDGWRMGVLQLSQDSTRNEDTPEEDRQHMGTVQHAQVADRRIVRDRKH